MALTDKFKIYYSEKTFAEAYEGWSPEERKDAKEADVILSKDGYVLKDRYDGRNFKGNT